MVVVLGLIYMLLFVAAFATLAFGLDSGNSRATTVGIVLVAIWVCCAVIH